MSTEKPKKRGLFRRLLSASHSSLRQAMHPGVTHDSTSPSKTHLAPTKEVESKNSNVSLVAKDDQHGVPLSQEITPPATPENEKEDTNQEQENTENQDIKKDGENVEEDEANDSATTPNPNRDYKAKTESNGGELKTSDTSPNGTVKEETGYITPNQSKTDMESPDLDKDPGITTVQTPAQDSPVAGEGHDDNTNSTSNGTASNINNTNNNDNNKTNHETSNNDNSTAEIAFQLYEEQADFVSHDQVASWIGDSGIERAEIRSAYMNLFDWSDKSILTSVRSLCEKLYLKAESQQLDRLIDAFADRWVECNPQHGFKSPGVVYTLAYSILLLNTDHHSEDYQGAKKMSRSQYVNQTLDTMRNLLRAEDCSVLDNASTLHDNDLESVTSRRQNSIDSLSYRPSTSSKKRWSINNGRSSDNTSLVCDSISYNNKEWEQIVVAVLKSVYASIDLLPLNLAHSDTASISSSSRRIQPQTSYGSLTRPSPRDTSSLLSRFSLNRRSSWMNGSSDTWSDYELQGAITRESKHSLTKRRSMYAESASSLSSGLGIEGVGFAGALRNTMIREEGNGGGHGTDLTKSMTGPNVSDAASMTTTGDSVYNGNAQEYENSTGNNVDSENGGASGGAAADSSLALHGAPWAKEGLLKFQAFFDGGNVGKKYKKRDWVQVFVVVQQGYIKMFRFDQHNSTSQNLAHRRSRGRLAQTSSVYSTNGLTPSVSANQHHATSPQIGAGNWLDNAKMTDNICLCHCMAQINPVELEEKTSKQSKRSSIIMSSSQPTDKDSTQWSLTLPSNGTLVFLAGTKEIAEEYVYACNYWASRVSKEPLIEAVSSVEYGWGRPIEILKVDNTPKVNSGAFDTLVVNSERIQVKEWKPPILSTAPNSLLEQDQLAALRAYIETATKLFEEHSAIRGDMMKMFQPGYLVSTRAHSNWEKRSGYLLKETVKYGLYVSTLERAIEERSSLEALDGKQQENEDQESENLGEGENKENVYTNEASADGKLKEKGAVSNDNTVIE